MSVKLPTEHHLEFLSLKRGCTSSSEYSLVKMPYFWKSHGRLKCTFLLFSNEIMLVLRARIHKMLFRIANREDPDQTASSEAVCAVSLG